MHFADDFVAPTYSPVHPPPFNTVEVNYMEVPPLNELFDQVSNILTSSSKVQSTLLCDKFSKSCSNKTFPWYGHQYKSQLASLLNENPTLSLD